MVGTPRVEKFTLDLNKPFAHPKTFKGRSIGLNLRIVWLVGLHTQSETLINLISNSIFINLNRDALVAV